MTLNKLIAKHVIKFLANYFNMNDVGYDPLQNLIHLLNQVLKRKMVEVLLTSLGKLSNALISIIVLCY